MKSIHRTLWDGKAEANQLWSDAYGNRWLVKRARDGFRLDGYDGIPGATDNASIPYWLTFCIELPALKWTGLRYVPREERGDGPSIQGVSV